MPVSFKGVSFEWPNGDKVCSDLHLSLEAGRKYGLIGPNGIGKSTLAKLALGDLQPAAGTLTRDVRMAAFVQTEAPPPDPAGDYLSGLWGDLASTEAPTVALLQEGLDLSASCLALSGGEWTRVRLLKLLASGADFFVLDEPSNNLDASGRKLLQSFIRSTRKGLLLISHDRILLSEVDEMLELSDTGLASFGGNWAFYAEARARERKRLAEELEEAARRRDRAAAQKEKKVSSQEKRMRRGRKSAENSGLPKILLGARKRRAQETMGGIFSSSYRKLEDSLESARLAFERLKIDPVIYADLPETSLPSGKLVFDARDFNFRHEGAAHDLWRPPLTFRMDGPRRLAISGPNGSGKTTLLNLLTGFKPVKGRRSGRLTLGGVSFAVLDQGLSSLDEGLTVLDNVRARSRLATPALRNLLARFLFPGDRAFQEAATLSGGERLRASLAMAIAADPAPQLLVLDEPTNNLDLANIEFLERALARYKGAVIIVSHDREFLKGVGVDGELRLG